MAQGGITQSRSQWKAVTEDAHRIFSVQDEVREDQTLSGENRSAYGFKRPCKLFHACTLYS